MRWQVSPACNFCLSLTASEIHCARSVLGFFGMRGTLSPLNQPTNQSLVVPPSGMCSWLCRCFVCNMCTTFLLDGYDGFVPGAGLTDCTNALLFVLQCLVHFMCQRSLLWGGMGRDRDTVEGQVCVSLALCLILSQSLSLSVYLPLSVSLSPAKKTDSRSLRQLFSNPSWQPP